MSQGAWLSEGVAPLGVALQGVWPRRAWFCVGCGSAGCGSHRGRGSAGRGSAGVTRDFLLLPPSVLPLLSCQSSLLGPGGKPAQPLGLGFPDWAASPLPAGRVRLLWAKTEVLKFRSWAPGTGCAPVAPGWTPRIQKCPQPRRATTTFLLFSPRLRCPGTQVWLPRQPELPPEAGKLSLHCAG